MDPYLSPLARHAGLDPSGPLRWRPVPQAWRLEGRGPDGYVRAFVVTWVGGRMAQARVPALRGVRDPLRALRLTAQALCDPEMLPIAPGSGTVVAPDSRGH